MRPLFRFRAATAFVIGWAMFAGVRLGAAPSVSPDFEEHILPLFYNRCFSCHSEKQAKPKGDLRLDSVEGIRASGVIVPGQPDESELMIRVSRPHADEDLMPRLKGGGQPLNEAELALLRRWIADGAKTGAWKKFNHREAAVVFSQASWSRTDVPALTQNVDKLVAAYHAKKGTALNPPVSDEGFLRRVYLDVVGRIPSLVESRAFLNSPSPNKRARLIDTLLASEGFVSHHFNWKADQLRLISQGIPGQPGWLYDEWVKDSIRSGMAYDEFVRRLITACGYLWENGAVGFYVRDLGMPLDHMSNLSRVFLGTRIECAQCHDHPLEPVSQKDFYELTAYTYGVSNLRSSSGYSTDNVTHWKELMARLDGSKGSDALKDGISRTTSYLKRLTTDTKHRLTFPEDYATKSARGTTAEFRTPFGDEAPATIENRREALAEWLVSPRNPRFARNITNRLWRRVIGVGLIEPVDSLSPVNRPELPELLAFLTEAMVGLKFDERTLFAVVLNSRLYQSEPVREELEPGAVFSLAGPLLRRLSAEQMWDSLLTFLVEDLDARKSLLRHDQTGLNPERLIQLTAMSADELLARSKLELEFRQKFRAHKIQLTNDQNAIQAAIQAGDFKTAKRLQAESAAANARFEKWRNEIQMGATHFAEETDPRWRKLPPTLIRASEVITPIELGHFLRQFGQSDRREIDAFNRAPNLTHSLALMNGELTRLILAEQSYLRRTLQPSPDPEPRVRTLYQAMLVRRPTAEEAKQCWQAFEVSPTPETDIIWALLNSPEFMFIQ